MHKAVADYCKTQLFVLDSLRWQSGFQVQEDVIASLGLQDALMLVSSFNRPNIMYKVRYLTSQAADPVPAVVTTLRRARDQHPGMADMQTASHRGSQQAWPCSKPGLTMVPCSLGSSGIPCQGDQVALRSST